MTINSRSKGKRGELELVNFLKSKGYELARRGQQYSGTETSADVVVPGLEEYHIECKRVEAGNPYVWLDQAVRDCGAHKTPVVAHCRNRREWIIIMRLEDWLNTIPTRGVKL